MIHDIFSQEYTARSVFVLKNSYIDTYTDEWQELVRDHIYELLQILVPA